MRLILSVDDGVHLPFVPLCATAWKKLFPDMKISIAAVIKDGNEHLIKKWVSPYVDDCCILSDSVNEKMHRSPMAKLARLWNATRFTNDILYFNDIDLIPLQKQYFQEHFDNYEANKMLFVGMNVYDKTNYRYGFPRMPLNGGVITDGKLFNEIVNPFDKTWYQFVNSLCKRGWIHDENKADPLNAPWFSDEYLLCDMISEWLKKKKKNSLRKFKSIPRKLYRLRDTIDRSDWHLMDIDKVQRGGYYYAHCLKNPMENIHICKKTGGPGLLPIIQHFDLEQVYEN